MNIGDLFLRVLADDKGFAADLTQKAGKAGDEAGASLGQRLGEAVKTNGAKIIGTVLAAGLAIAGKGLLELQNITADFRAETGATADEADRAGKAILAMSSRNLQPMAEIGDALTKVHTDLGEAGDEAERTTQRFLKFGRVTKENAAVEVVAFREILDAWNLSADKTGAIMDALVLSHQRYGGAIAQDEAALRDLAPSLLAANMTWQDGLGLINLFKASGVDVAVAITGMTKALAKVKSPAELKVLVADIIATEDPFLRAQKAADLFGVKAGAKLANVLKPGVVGLDDYAISADDAAGATEKAADVLDSTFGARFQLMIKAAGSAIIGLGNDWGGLATVIATAIQVAGGLGGVKFVTALAGGLKAMWFKATGSAIVTKAVAFAASKAATIYLAGLIAGDAIGGALSKAWAATGGRMIAAAGISGAAAGRAFSIGAAAAIVAAPLAVIFVEIQVAGDIKTQTADLAKQVGEFTRTATTEELIKARKGVAEDLAAAGNDPIAEFLGLSAKKGIEDTLAGLDKEIAARAEPLAPALNMVTAAAVRLGSDGKAGFDAAGDAARRLTNTVATHAALVASTVARLTSQLLAEALALITGYYDPIIAQDTLRAQKAEVAANQVALAATKAGSAERAQALLTLHTSQEALAQTRANLLASGTLTAREQKAWLAELQAKYKTATGDARAKIQALINKIHELQNVPSTVVKVTIGGFQMGGKAEGGAVEAGRAYVVGEKRPELFIPKVDGRILPSVPSMASPTASSAIASGNTYQVNVQGLLRARSPSEIGDQLRRLADFGVLPPRPVDG